MTRHGVARLTVLHGGGDTPLQSAVQRGPVPWTVLEPVEFMANALDWAETVRSGAEVAEPFIDRLSAMVHEADIGDVAAASLVEDGHAGQSYVITGPQLLTVRDKVNALAAALERPIGLRELTEEEAITGWRAAGYDEETIAFARSVFGDTPEVGRTVVDTVPRITGHPARTFAQWAQEHVDAFR